MKKIEHFVHNEDGWELSLRQVYDPDRLDPDMRPVAIIPGYGMNTFIFGWHPSGLPLEDYLAHEGFEVWSVNLRNQGQSVSRGGGPEYTLRDVALTDVAAAFRTILAQTATNRDGIDVIGASLGATITYVHLALRGDNPIGSVVGLGGPLRWERIHPALALAFGSPALAGQIRFKGSRALARKALPLMLKAPGLLSIYLHPEIVDTSDLRTLTEVVEDPNRFLNREIARWFKTRDLFIEGVNITERMRRVRNPFLCVLANADGIVPPATALSAYEHIGAHTKHVLEVGDERLRFAHADLFVSRYSQDMVFAPIARWLRERYEE